MNENTICVGSVCLSVAGHDKGRAFVVVAIESDFAYLVNGKDRKKQKPKKKKIKHLKLLSVCDNDFAERLLNGEEVANETFRKMTSRYN